MSITNSISIKVVAGLVGIALALGLAFAFAAPAKAATVEELQAQITQLLALISSLQAQISGLGGSTSTSNCGFTRDLTLDVSGDDVKCLQNYLTSTGHFTFSGGATGFFGPITRTAVSAWQTANNVSPTAGYFGSISRAKYNSLLVASAPAPAPAPAPGDTTTPAPAPTGTGLSVAAAAQPAATLAVFNAARVPFTKFTLTAGTDGAVAVTGVTIERQGLAADGNFASLSLLDENGIQVGNTKTLNSNHQAIFTEKITIPAGMTKTFTVAGNMSTAANVNGGEVGSIAVVGISTSATLSGALPIVGASHTMNDTLAIGSVTVARSPIDPNGAVTKEVGVTDYTFSSLRVTAGSVEKVRLWSVTWNQGSSTAAADLTNVVVKVNDTEYPTTVAGDDYTATFPGGILIDKGLNADVSIIADIAGGSGRTITFNIDDTTDLYMTGEQYNYGITPPTSGTGITSGNIWFAGSTVTVSAGTITVSQDTSVASQNVAINLAGQPLAGINVDVDGEAVSVAQIVFDVATTTGEWGESALLTDVTLVDQNGTVVAGPVDTTGTGATITFTDTVTFPEGVTKYTVKGKLGTGVANDGTYRLTTNPATDWTTVTGDNTGDTITPGPSGDQALQTMTAKTAAITLSVSNTPAAQTVVAGAQSFNFANYQFDGTASGEDVRFNNIPLAYDTTGTATDLTKCQLYDGSTALNTGTNIVDPSAAGSSTTFTFDTGFVIPKGTIKTLALKCNVITGVTATYYWGYDSDQTPSGTGVTSGQSATITENDSIGQIITMTANGTLLVTLDSSSPSYAIASAESTGNALAVLRFEAQTEAVNLERIAFQLTTATASSTASDLTLVTLWDGATKVGEVIFTGTNTVATSTLTTPVQIPKDGYKLITVKGDFAGIGTGKPGTQGHIITVDYDGDATIGTRGIGVASGATINHSSTSDTAATGVRVFRSYPILERIAVPTNTLSNGTKTLARWKVTAAPQGDIGIAKFTLAVGTTTASVDTLEVYCFTDSGFSSICTGLQTDGALLGTSAYPAAWFAENWADSNTQINFHAEDSTDASTTIQVPAGLSRYFEARATVSASAAGASVSTRVEGDAAYALLLEGDGAFMFAESTSSEATFAHNDFIWSPNATTTSLLGNQDWTNGYGVSGLPGTNMLAETLSQ